MFRKSLSSFPFSAFLSLFFLFLIGCNGSDGSGMGSDMSVGDIRTFDGSGNNLNDSHMGYAGSSLSRMMDAEYLDGTGMPMMEDRPNPRAVSNAVMNADGDQGNSRGLSSFVWQWGQFLDHDISLTPEKQPHEVMPLNIPTGDPYFDPHNTGVMIMPLNRSIYKKGTGEEFGKARQQMNMITCWIDGSNVYGSDNDRASWLRTYEGGRLKTSTGEMLPFNDGSQENAGPEANSTRMFVAGDVRANEQLGLTALHILFVREHNRLADEIAAANPDYSDEEIFQRARKFVGAFLQTISYQEFLPALLGSLALPGYNSYDSSLNASIRNEFSTAIYRLGHSMIPSKLLLVEDDGSQIQLPLREAFFRPDKLRTISVESIFRGLAAQQMEEIDLKINEDLRNFLFGAPGHGGFDLATLNILRARDHGIPNYNALRNAFGLEPLSDFSELTENAELASKLESLYLDINNLDAWVGALAEDHVPEAGVGQLIAVGLLYQFRMLRDGDRFWFENDPNFSGNDIELIRNTKLSDIIERNTNASNLPENVFFAG